MGLRYVLFTDVFALLGLLVLGASPQHLSSLAQDLALGALAALLLLVFCVWLAAPAAVGSSTNEGRPSTTPDH